MAGSFPTGITTYTNPGPTDTTATTVGARTHDQFHADNNDDLEQVMTKLGTGASTATANTVLRGTGSGTTAFGAVTTDELAANAATQRQIVNVSSLSTTSTSIVVMTGTDITMTTTGGPVLLLATGYLRIPSGTSIVGILAMGLDGTSQGEYFNRVIWDTTDYSGFTIAQTLLPAAGAHTFTVLWRVSSGTLNLAAITFSAIEFKR